MTDMTSLSLLEAEKRYPIIRFFRHAHLSERLQFICNPFIALALLMAEQPRNAETSAGLRKLLEAQECAVRAALPTLP